MSIIKITDTQKLALPKESVSTTVLSEFKTALNSYISKINIAVANEENEEHIKNIINDFLRMSFYSDSRFSINTDGNIDSSIKENGKLLAIIEAKAPQNKSEMVTEENINKKALWEAVYYYLEKTIDVSHSKAMVSTTAEVRRLIITDGFKWFLVDSAAVHSIVDGEIERRFWQYKNNKLPYSNDTSAFYEELKQHLEKKNITEEMDYIYFDISECVSKKQSLSNLYKILSESYLLKNTPRVNYEPHSLNSNFYHELLYIMGLKENTQDNKLVVEIDPTIKNTLADQVYHLLKDKEIDDDKISELTFETIIIWINRLLFIKLFEGQLILFNSDAPEYHILSHDKITDFDDLQNLFFDVLGTKNRAESEFLNKFSKVPYLNSSLFERSSIENEFVHVRYLHNDLVDKKSKSVLGNKAPKQIPLLVYIIDFLNSYNFMSDICVDNCSNQKEIIDAAVLGLIFEKLNGYKDGANYTPSVITEYIAKEAVEKAVLNAVNAGMNWKCNDLSDIEDKIETRDERIQINNIINTIKICDPAVGSGHFLVSVLNRIIAVKKQLGVLFKYNSIERIKEYNITVEDDVLTVRDGNGNPFVYDKNNNESREVQETLFNEKRIIIENCLFGVDVNSKAVHICQLRLWIELLKNAYYKNGVMETLPNIDINIKVGNSLMSKINFVIGKKAQTDKDTGKIINKYKELVQKYKSVSDKSEKKLLLKELRDTKDQVHGLYEQISFFTETDSTFDSAFEWAFEFPEILDEKGKFIGFDVVIGNPPYIQLQSMHEEADKLKKMDYRTYARTGDIYCLFYELAYKLLKKDGILAFITSNKWMKAGYGEALRNFLATQTDPMQLIDFAGEKIFDSATVDVNILMYQKRKNQNKTAACIIKDSGWRNNLSGYFHQNSMENRFDNSASWIILSPIEQSIKRKIESIGVPLKDWDISINYGIKTGFNEAFIIDGKKKDELIAADPKSAEIIRPILRGRDIKRYSYEFANLYIIATFPSKMYNIDDYPAVKKYLLSFGIERLEQTGKTYRLNGTTIKARKKTTNKWFETQDSISYWDDFSKQKIIWGEISDKPKFALDKKGEYSIVNTVFMMTGENLSYLITFLNSKLSEYYFSQIATTTGVGTVRWLKYKIELLPIPPVNCINKTIVDKLEGLCDIKNTNDVSNLIDETIYTIYSFSDEEIALVSGFESKNAISSEERS